VTDGCDALQNIVVFVTLFVPRLLMPAYRCLRHSCVHSCKPLNRLLLMLLLLFIYYY